MFAQDENHNDAPPTDSEPPARAAEEAAEKAEAVEYFLIHAANGTEVAWNVSNALESLESATFGSTATLSAEACNHLIQALFDARDRILALFHQPGDRSAAAEGCEAVIGLLLCWRNKGEQPAVRRGSTLIDLKARARILRNLCHNICLREEIEQRRTERFEGIHEAPRGRKTSAYRTAM